MKTNAARILDELGIPYEVREYEVDPNDLSAGKVAVAIGMPLDAVFKTLLARGKGGDPLMAVVPGDAELDLKALARAAGERKVAMVPLAEVQPLTGYVRGGVTALGAKRRFEVYLDESARTHPTISISAGIRGAQLLVSPDDYARATAAHWAPIARPGSTDPRNT